MSSEVFHAFQKIGERELLQLRHKLPMIPRGRCIGRKEQGIRYVGAIGHIDRLKIKGRTDQNDSVQRHCVPVLQIVTKTSRPRRAVTFASQKSWRSPSAVFRRPQPDEIPHVLNILFVSPELTAILAVSPPPG